MKFLIDVDLPHWMVDAFAAEGHDAIHAEELGLSRSIDQVIAEQAREAGRCVLSGDFDFSDIRNYPPRRYRGIVVLWIPRNAGTPYMRLLLAEFLEYLRQGGTVDGKLLIVEIDRIRIRE